jgi:uncharacterized protein (DUF1330 family)
MAAYFVAIRESVHDQAELAEYAKLAGKSAEGHALTPRALYGRIRTTEGAPLEGAVILEFPTFAEAEAWYDSEAYQAAAVHRFRGATYRTFILEGVPATSG